METMKALVWSWLVAGVSLGTAVSAGGQTPVGALAIDERQGDQYGWAVDYETAAAAQAAALRECGAGCSVVLTFDRCGAYAADQDATSTAMGWAESYDSAARARQAALSECSSRGGSGCTVRVWGCNGPVAEEGLGLDRAARRQIQLGLSTAGFDPGGADGLFGPRTRAAIRNWQSARGARTTGYLDGPQIEALGGRGGSLPPASAGAAAADSEGLEVVFWQSIVNSTNPADFEAYLEQFPNGVFVALARNRLAALRGSEGGGVRATASGSRVSGAPAPASGAVAGADARPRAGAMFRPAQTCAGQPAGAACWQEVSGQPGCYVWNPNRQLGSTVTWTGECAGGLAQGAGTLTWVWEGNRQRETGRLQDGERTGHWVLRFANGNVEEGPFVNGERTGHWVLRFANGNVEEGPYVNGERTGHWVLRFATGDVEEGPYVNGERTGHWVLRFATGDVQEGPFVNGEQHGSWVVYAASGTVYDVNFVNGEPGRVERRGVAGTGSPERGRGQGSACTRQRLIDLGVLNSSINPSTIQFTGSRMIITQSDGAAISTRQESEYNVTSDAITYRIVQATGTAPGYGSRDIPIVNAGPHTVACSVSGRVLSFGDGTWR